MNRDRRYATRPALALAIALTSLSPALTAQPAMAATGSDEALARLVDAFAGFQRAARPLVPGADIAAVMPRLSAARADLLDAAVRLGDVTSSGHAFSAAAPVQTPCLDLVGVDSTYTTNCALLVDVGGSDVYANNAGGVDGGAAALIDLGGNDRYGGTLNSGANGGAVAGAGFLYDASGDDAYSAGSNGTNGGGYFFGSGFLLDGGGNDRYTATQSGTNGGAHSVASGHLIDLGAGADSYSATRFGVNGGSTAGTGLLLDAGGTDTYSDQEACSASGVDRTVVPTGMAGGQIDSPITRSSTCPPGVVQPPPRPAFGSVTGTVTDARGPGIVGAQVQCGGAPPAVALADGRYTVPVASAGANRCTASAVGFRPKPVDLTVTEGATTVLNFALRRA
ncbi:MAG TPA: carboxypeptidase-like regulatory domain-containing protein [Actinomycetota bacterium]|nr:carboxypeptidase-like regulatory domain-containing protein [Actinomycetota bacterium]